MKLKSIRWGAIVGTLILGLSAVAVGRAVAGSDPTVPRESDEKIAERELSNADEKLFVPEGSFVGGQGVVEPADRETKVAAAVSGRIAVVHVKEGDRVKKGDVLVELDSEIERAAVASAEADVLADEADRTRVRSGERWEDRLAADEDAKAAQARAAQSQGILERTRKAHAGGAVTGDELDRAEKQAAQDAASAAAAEARKKAAVNGSRIEEVRVADAKLAASKARLAEAKARLEQRLVKAPIDGDILSVKVRAGEFYQPGSDSVVVMGDTTHMRVRIDIDERDLARVAVGARVIARVPARPGENFEGKVVEIGRRMGRKNVRSDDPVERNDAKILEVVAEMNSSAGLVVGQRVTGFVETPSE
jgi:HlyD family secretion protein